MLNLTGKCKLSLDTNEGPITVEVNDKVLVEQLLRLLATRG